VPRLVRRNEILRQAAARPRFLAVLLGGFAAIALLLAAIGTLGGMSCSTRATPAAATRVTARTTGFLGGGCEMKGT
jgi:hypothetical protein